jgi:hypothetical protein
MDDFETDMEPVIAAAARGEDRGESISLMEPLLVPEGSRHRSGLTDLAVDLAARSAGFRRSLPEGVVAALADLVRAMNCYYSNLIEGHDPPGRYRAGAQKRLQRRPRKAQSAAGGQSPHHGPALD